MNQRTSYSLASLPDTPCQKTQGSITSEHQNRRSFLKHIALFASTAPMLAGVSQLANAQPSVADSVQALVFDVFGTVVDWRASIIREGQLLAARKGYEIDWGEFADRWRSGYGPAMNKVRTGELPWTKIDDLHRMILDELVLEFGLTGMTEAEILCFTRMAASAVGGTTMDRPEWVAVHPNNKTVFCTLTNNKHRGKKDNQPVDGPNPRINNKYGQIVRWWPANADHAAAEFDWDLLVVAGNPTVHSGNLYAGSENISEDNMFNSPDGIGFDQAGRLWIQTDGKYSNKDDFAGMGNNQMLCADPETGEIRRFATGPVACEITGLTFSPDQRTMFVGIQHPGEKDKPSHFPAGGNSKPRSTIMVVRRNDGGIIGA